MSTRLTLQPAEESELPAALEIVFRHLNPDERETRVRNGLRLIRQGELNPAGVIVAREGEKRLGAMVCLPVPGAGALIWPPQSTSPTNATEIEDYLLEYGCSWLRRLGVKLAQCLVVPNEKYLAETLLRNGFTHITNLDYLRHELHIPQKWRQAENRYTYKTYAQCNHALFHKVLLQTYVDTLDCPEVNGVREIQEIIEGHRSQGLFDPERWWLAFDASVPIGVILLTEVLDWNGWDLSYLGVVPAYRRQGAGREFTRKALLEASQANAGQLTLALDVRNTPASRLYRSMGFTFFDEREVYLAIWNTAETKTQIDE
jgi:mycothiol synthase